MKHESVLVTGGAGFIGSNLVRRLVENGNNVTVIDNLSSGYASNLDAFPTVRLVKGDIRDEAAIAAAMSGVMVVFHCAASVGNKRSIDDPITDAEINVVGTLRVLEAARRQGVRKIVAASSAGIFGELKTLPIREDHPVEPDSPYGCTKLCAEKLCLAYAKLYDMEVVCLRYFNVYGPNQRFDAYGNVIPIFVFRMLRGKPLIIFGDGEQTRDFVHVDDVVQANINAAGATGVTGAFNIASGTRVTINRLVGIIAKENATAVMVEHGPVRPGDVLHSLADLTMAKKLLDYSPSMALDRGIHEYVAWARGEV